mmetsp:Transcript_11286/g.47121  ORF Transcript_11286/g.47121 Transcript_11286/m.47121 type:complete len:108 (-) Transcript_11286:2629-2952(-)
MLELLCLDPVGVDACASVRRPCINNCSRAVGLYVCVDVCVHGAEARLRAAAASAADRRAQRPSLPLAAHALRSRCGTSDVGGHEDLGLGASPCQRGAIAASGRGPWN